jgi:hypothetical protein
MYNMNVRNEMKLNCCERGLEMRLTEIRRAIGGGGAKVG